MSNSAGTVFKTRFLPGDGTQVLSEHISFHTACRASPGYKRLQKSLATYNLSTDCAKFTFKNCGSCLKAVVLIFKYPPQCQNVGCFWAGESIFLADA